MRIEVTEVPSLGNSTAGLSGGHCQTQTKPAFPRSELKSLFLQGTVPLQLPASVYQASRALNFPVTKPGADLRSLPPRRDVIH